MKKLLCFALCLFLLAGLVGCDSSPKYDMYYFVEMVEANVSYTADQLQKELDEEGKGVKLNDIFYLKLYDNGTAVMCSMGIEENMKYNDTEMWSANDETLRAKYTLEGDMLTLEEGGARMIYKKG